MIPAALTVLRFFAFTKLGRAIALALLLAAALWGFGQYRYNEGYNDAVADVAEQNAQAIAKVNERRSLARDCNSTAGMRWDQVARQCVKRP